MAMYSIRLDGDTRAMLRRIRSFSEIDKQGINAALAEGARESTLERFKQSKGPDGRRWKTSIRAAQEGGKTLIQSAQLRNSIHAKSDTSGFAVGTNVKYAATHQFGEPGRTIRARKKKALRFQVGGKVGHEEASPHHHPGPSLPRSLRGRYAGDEGDGRGVHPEGGLISCSTRKASNISSTS